MTAIRILSAGAVKRGVARLAQAYATETGTHVDVEFATAPELRRRLAAGEQADVVVAPPAVLDELAASGRIAPDSRCFIGRARMGVVVHLESKVHAIPDVETFKGVLTEANYIVHNRASSGIYAEKLVEKLGLRDIVASRIVVVESGAAVMECVAQHGAGAIGLAQISEIQVLVEKGLPVRLAAALPDGVQNVTAYEAAAVARRPSEKTNKALARYLATDADLTVFAATGID